MKCAFVYFSLFAWNATQGAVVSKISRLLDSDTSMSNARQEKKFKTLPHLQHLQNLMRQGGEASLVQEFQLAIVPKGSPEAKEYVSAGLLVRVRAVSKALALRGMFATGDEGRCSEPPNRFDGSARDSKLPPHTQCLQATMSDEVWCFIASVDCCSAIRNSRGALKVVPKPY